MFPWHSTVSKYQHKHYLRDFSHQPWEVSQTRVIIAASQVEAQVRPPGSHS